MNRAPNPNPVPWGDILLILAVAAILAMAVFVSVK